MLQIDLGIILGLVECLSVHFTLLPDNHNKLHLILHQMQIKIIEWSIVISRLSLNTKCM